MSKLKLPTISQFFTCAWFEMYKNNLLNPLLITILYITLPPVCKINDITDLVLESDQNASEWGLVRDHCSREKVYRRSVAGWLMNPIYAAHPTRVGWECKLACTSACTSTITFPDTIHC